MIRRILVTRTDRIGDVVLSTPVFSALRDHYPDAHIAALVADSNKELVDGNPFLNEVILYDKKGQHASWWDNFWFARKLSKKRFDVIVNLHPTNRIHWISYLAGIPKRIGYGKKNAFLLTDTIPDEKWQGLRHESEYNFDLLKLIDVRIPEKMNPYIPLKLSHKLELEAILQKEGISLDQPYVVIHPSASCPSRLWRSERYAQVADELARRWRVNIILISAPGTDSIFVKRVRTFMRERSIDLAGKLSLGVLAWLLKSCSLLISNDSGPMHVAAAFDTPIIAIFGRNQVGLSPKRWRPLGRNSFYVKKDVGCIECAAHRCDLGFLCLDEVTVKDVLEVAEKYEERIAC